MIVAAFSVGAACRAVGSPEDPWPVNGKLSAVRYWLNFPRKHRACQSREPALYPCTRENMESPTPVATNGFGFTDLLNNHKGTAFCFSGRHLDEVHTTDINPAKAATLASLDLSTNDISSLLPSFGETFINLSRLDFSTNAFTMVPETIFQLVNLTALSFASNGLTDLPDFSVLPKLEVLDLSSNEITRFPIAPSVSSMLISDNPITMLPDLSSMKVLTVLDVQRTRLTYLPRSIGTLKRLAVLKIHPLDITQGVIPPEVSTEGPTAVIQYNKMLAKLPIDNSLDTSNNRGKSLRLRAGSKFGSAGEVKKMWNDRRSSDDRSSPIRVLSTRQNSLFNRPSAHRQDSKPHFSKLNVGESGRPKTSPTAPAPQVAPLPSLNPEIIPPQPDETTTTTVTPVTKATTEKKPSFLKSLSRAVLRPSVSKENVSPSPSSQRNSANLTISSQASSKLSHGSSSVSFDPISVPVAIPVIETPKENNPLVLTPDTSTSSHEINMGVPTPKTPATGIYVTMRDLGISFSDSSTAVEFDLGIPRPTIPTIFEKKTPRVAGGPPPSEYYSPAGTNFSYGVSLKILDSSSTQCECFPRFLHEKKGGKKEERRIPEDDSDTCEDFTYQLKIPPKKKSPSGIKKLNLSPGNRKFNSLAPISERWVPKGAASALPPMFQPQPGWRVTSTDTPLNYFDTYKKSNLSINQAQTRHDYQNFFYNNPHINICGLYKENGQVYPFSLSIMTVPDPDNNFMNRALLRTCKGDDRSWVNPKSLKHQNLGKLVSGLDVWPSAAQISKIAKVKKPGHQEAFLATENKFVLKTIKVGLIYCGPGQTTEAEMLSNKKGSQEFDDFVSFMGDIIPLRGWPKFDGGLDTVGDRTGTHSLFATYEGTELMFHVSTMIPGDADDDNLTKKKYIGNDVVVIVFLGANQTAFTPTSLFNHVCLFVQPFQLTNTTRRYMRLTVATREGIIPASPHLPPGEIYERNALFKHLVLAQIINSEYVAFQTGRLCQIKENSRRAWLAKLYSTWSGNMKPPKS